MIGTTSKTLLQAVVRNKGAPGVDGMTVKQLPDALKERWPPIASQLLEGRLSSATGASGEDPEAGRGRAHLGIPTVIDRMIQQAILQRLQPLWDATFSEHSFGFRPGRSAHQAVAQAQAYVIDRPSVCRGYRPGEVLRPGQPRPADGARGRTGYRQAGAPADPGFLTAGVLDNGLFEASEEGTPQGGPLSPLLSNLVLDELDRNWSGAATASCATRMTATSTCAVEKAAERVMSSVTRFIERRLKLQGQRRQERRGSTVETHFPRLYAAEGPGFAGASPPRPSPGSSTGSRADAAASGRQSGADDRDLARILRDGPATSASVSAGSCVDLEGWVRRRLRCAPGTSGRRAAGDRRTAPPKRRPNG